MAPRKGSGRRTRKETNSTSNRAQRNNHSSVLSDENIHESDTPERSRIPIELQQLLLNIFNNAFSDRLGVALPSLIQEVKQHLFNRDFNQAFGSQSYLQAYAIRWSPSRALAYLDIFTNIPDLRDNFTRSAPSATLSAETPCSHVPHYTSRPQAQMNDNGMLLGLPLQTLSDGGKACNVVCLGGGAGAEIVALAAYVHHLRSSSGPDHSTNEGSPTTDDYPNVPKLVVNSVDIADWSQVVQDLYQGVTKPLHLSQFASSAAKAANKPLIIPEGFSCTFRQQDLLDLNIEELTHILEGTTMVTLMFTLNELYSVSMVKTTNFLLALTSLLEAGTRLLVVDSPGSYSTVAVGSTGATTADGTAKKYPMQWLLDHTLLKASSIGSSQGASEGGQWEKLMSEDSRWFRVPEGLQYPVTLENMRYQLHFYRHK